MAQVTTLTLPNSGGSVFRANTNNMLAALFSSNSGPSAPSPTVGGMLWLDTGVSPPVLRRMNTANTAWIAVAPETIPATTIWGNQLGAASAPAAIDMAMLRTMLGVVQNLAANGYVRIPGGLILNWLTISALGSGANSSQSFPATFPTAAVFGSIQYADFTSNAAVGSTFVAQLRDLSTTGMTIRNLGPNTAAFYCFALGY